jgi:hypothetical protein
LALLQAEAGELRYQAIQLRNQANLLMERSELVEAQAEQDSLLAEQAAYFVQTSERQHDERQHDERQHDDLVKLALVNKNTRELIKVTALGSASRKRLMRVVG